MMRAFHWQIYNIQIGTCNSYTLDAARITYWFFGSSHADWAALHRYYSLTKALYERSSSVWTSGSAKATNTTTQTGAWRVRQYSILPRSMSCFGKVFPLDFICYVELARRSCMCICCVSAKVNRTQLPACCFWVGFTCLLQLHALCNRKYTTKTLENWWLSCSCTPPHTVHHQDRLVCKAPLNTCSQRESSQKQSWASLHLQDLQAVLAASWLVSCHPLGESKGLGHCCSLYPGVALARLPALYTNHCIS